MIGLLAIALCFIAFAQSNAISMSKPPTDSAGDGIIKDLRFEIPSAVQNKKGVHIRILLDQKELFRGNLAAVKGGDFNFTVPDSVLHNGENKMIVQFFIPPSEATVAQSFLMVDVGITDKLIPGTAITQKRVVAAVGASALLGLGLRRALRSADRQEHRLPVVDPLGDPPLAVQPVASPEPIAPAAPPPPAEQKEEVTPKPSIPLVRPSIVRSDYKSCLQKENIMKQLDIIRNNKMTSVAVGTILLSPFSARALKFGKKEKVHTSPIAKVVDINFGKARAVLIKAWEATTRLLKNL